MSEESKHSEQPKKRPRVSILVAMARNRVIGRGGDLPWRLPADLRRFKQLTMGHPIIMGRKTYDSIGRALPGRTMIVISRTPGRVIPDAMTVTSLEAALTACSGSDEVFVIGGGEIYSQALPFADRLYVTAVDTDSEGDTYFPEWTASEWGLSEETVHPADPKNAFPMRFQIFDRIAR